MQEALGGPAVFVTIIVQKVQVPTVQVLWPANPGKVTKSNMNRVALLWGVDDQGVLFDAIATVGWCPEWGWGFLVEGGSLSMAHYMLGELLGRWVLTDDELFVLAPEAEHIGGDIIRAVYDLGVTRSAA